MSFGAFSGIVIGLLAVSLVIADALVDPATFRAIAYSAGVTGANALVAYALAIVGERRNSTRGFFLAVLGGMAIRMVLVLAAVVAGIRILGFSSGPLAVSFLAYTGIFMALEVLALHRRLKRRRFQSPPITA